MVDAQLRFRTATLADADALGRLNHQLVRDEGLRNPMNLAELTERMRGWLVYEGYEALLGFDGDELVAYVLWRDLHDSVYLRQIFVQRDYRRQGAARQLMLSVFERWPDKRLTVDVLAGNARARVLAPHGLPGLRGDAGAAAAGRHGGEHAPVTRR